MTASPDQTPHKKEPTHNIESIKVHIMNKLQWLRRHVKKQLPLEKMNETLCMIKQDAVKLQDTQVSKHLETLVNYINGHWPIDENLAERDQWDIKEVILSDIDHIMQRLLQI